MPWVLVVVEAMVAEWHLPLPQAMRFPMAQALTLWPALMARLGRDPGPSYADKARGRMRAKARAWLEAHYEIKPNG